MKELLICGVSAGTGAMGIPVSLALVFPYVPRQIIDDLRHEGLQEHLDIEAKTLRMSNYI